MIEKRLLLFKEEIADIAGLEDEVERSMRLKEACKIYDVERSVAKAALSEILDARRESNSSAQVISDFPFLKEKEEEVKGTEIARLYIANCAEVQRFLRYFQDDFYQYELGVYRRLAKYEIESKVTLFSQKINANVSATNLRDAMVNLKAMTMIPSTARLGEWLSSDESGFGSSIVLKNGILSVERFLQGDRALQSQHSPELFSVAKLPYEYDPSKKASTWLKILERALPDRDQRELLQEWFGYCLQYDTSLERFLLLEGQGANGKTVVCTVLRVLLGEENCSAVGLEAFDPRRTFPLAATVGKVANIVEELGEIDRVAEGLLKQFVSGGAMQAERKNREPFTFYPTARLTFATNVLPRIVDRSDGIWRRMLLIPFRAQIPESERNSNFVQPGWWKASGELPGILNWALEGLVRLRKRGRFSETAASKSAKAEYREQSNPAGTFLRDHARRTGKDFIATSELYGAYRNWCHSNGYTPLSQGNFSIEVKRTFPGIEATQNPIHQKDGKRSRQWIGLRLEDDDTGDTRDTGLEYLV